ncbi:hypothetical protein JCM10207_002256 [Rhodosporidiobolus poonsookiae]
MKYLFAAIDARQSRAKETARGGAANGRLARSRYYADELKRLVVEASEAVDDKAAATDFQETLERIVNEIKNTTEHSGAFLQKVRKADVPDYYDVIKRPMDLGSLLKKVKQQAYRTKKAFAEDLDLIWSNCLLYNSHPSHPLRHSAETLRAKSNQLLEFITDPAVTQRSILAASLGPAGLDLRRGSSTRIGTPDEDGDADAESDDERGTKRGMSLLNGLNGDYRDSSDSPAPSRAATPGLGRRLSRKISMGPLGRISPSPEPESPTELPFEERPAFVRTAEGMQSFFLLDNELTKLEGGLGFKPTSASASSILPSTAFDPSAALTRKGKRRVVDRIRDLHPSLLPLPPTPQPALNGSATPADGASPAPSAVPPPPPPPKRNPDEPLEALWWDVVAPASTSSALFPFSGPANSNGTHGAENGAPAAARDPVPVPAMAAGMPRVPWVGYVATPYETSTGSGKGKEKAGAAGGERKVAKKLRKKQKAAEIEGEGGEEKGLAGKMRRNCETLRKIRSVGAKLARESTSGSLDAPEVSSDESDLDLPNGDASEAMEVDGAEPPRKRRRMQRAVAVSTAVPRKAFRCPATAPVAAQEAMRAVAGGVLGHAGFEGAGAGALDILTNLATEYLTNLGRTLRFYSDRYGAELAPSHILTNTLAENGVPSPAALDAYVSDDIGRYGSRLTDLLRKLERTREEQLDGFTAGAESGEADEARFFAEDGEALVAGDFAEKIGDDFFGLGELGVDRDLPPSASLVPPGWLLKGEPRPDSIETGTTLTYSPPPAFIPLIPEAIPAQIGLLQPYYTLRASKPDLALLDDSLAPPVARPKGQTRHKVPPHGRIPFKGKKRPEDPTLPSAMAAAAMGSLGEPVRKKKKKTVQVAAAGSGDSGAE